MWLCVLIWGDSSRLLLFNFFREHFSVTWLMFVLRWAGDVDAVDAVDAMIDLNGSKLLRWVGAEMAVSLTKVPTSCFTSLQLYIFFLPGFLCTTQGGCVSLVSSHWDECNTFQALKVNKGSTEAPLVIKTSLWFAHLQVYCLDQVTLHVMCFYLFFFTPSLCPCILFYPPPLYSIVILFIIPSAPFLPLHLHIYSSVLFTIAA